MRAKPEVRHRDADKRERRRGVIDERARADRRKNSKGNREQHRRAHRRERQLKSSRQPFGNSGGNRLARPERHAEITLCQPREKAAVLHVQRAIEPEPAAQNRDVLRRGAVPEHRLHRIARHEMNKREHEGSHAEEDRNRQEDRWMIAPM